MSTLEAELETLIDDHGYHAVLEAVSNICALKAEHVASNWGDVILSRNWLRRMDRLDTLIGGSR